MRKLVLSFPLVLVATLAFWHSRDAQAVEADRGSLASETVHVADRGRTETRVAGINVHGNLRASAFVITDGHLRVGGLRRVHVLNPRVPTLNVEVRDGAGRLLRSWASQTSMRDGEQWVEIALDPDLGPLTVTLSR